MIGKTVRYNKFTFSDHSLAFQVRENMLKALIPYDINNNGLFEEPEIVRALIEILEEDENQIRYVISNVFRYDKDGDKAITYEEFTNFAVEQHFGEMAIQRLHRNGVYSKGSERKMNLQEFQTTLNECLKYIHSQGSSDIYELLFSEVDLDRDQWISYEDYFVFLREYFGSLSAAAEEQSRPKLPEVVHQEPSYESRIDYPEQRLARLIYTQLKISVMEHDLNKNLSLSKEEVAVILENLFRVQSNEKAELIDLIMGSEQVIPYEGFMKIMVPFYFCEYDVNRQGIQRSGENDFVENVRKASYFVRVKPSELILREIFRKYDSSQKGHLEKHEYINTLGNIFENYEFDNRGKGEAY